MYLKICKRASKKELICETGQATPLPPETMFVYWLPLPYIALANRCVDRCPQQTPTQVVYRWSQQIYDVGDVLVYLVEVSTATKQPEEPARVLDACANNVNMQRWGEERAFFVSAPLTASINNFLRSQKDPLPLPLLTYAVSLVAVARPANVCHLAVVRHGHVRVMAHTGWGSRTFTFALAKERKTSVNKVKLKARP